MKLSESDKLVGKYGNKGLVSENIVAYYKDLYKDYTPLYIDTIRSSERLTFEQKLECEISNLYNHIVLFISSNENTKAEKVRLLLILENLFGIGLINGNFSELIKEISRNNLIMRYTPSTFYIQAEKLYKRYPKFKEESEVKAIYDLFNECKTVGKE